MRSVVRRLAAAVAAILVISLGVVPPASAGDPAWSHRDLKVCLPGEAGSAACDSVVRVLYANGQEFRARSPQDLGRIAKPAASVSYTAVGIRTAYGITGQGDPSRVIAIVDAYDNAAAYDHLVAYRDAMGLPPIGSCSLSQLTSLASDAGTPCFAKVNQTGGTSYPRANSGWATEIDLDLQAASAVCPMCSLLLLEANSASFADLATAVTTASNTTHVLAISNSYSSTGDASGTSYPAWDNAAKKGIAVMASTGDSGYGVGFPASGTNVIGVGGTTLAVGSDGVRTSETAWSGSGSGCSTYNAAPSWQLIPSSPCGTKKAIADLSADADPNSGLQIYTTYNRQTGWYIFGGTSLSAPLMGALYAMQGGYGGTTLAGAYAWASTTAYYDVTSGSNGTCSPSVLCTAVTGWDGPTGLGSIQLETVPQTLASIQVSPANASVVVGGTQQFTATGYDQNGARMTIQPTFTWSATGVGSVDSASGLYSAGPEVGTATVSASVAGSSVEPGTASVSVTAAVPDFTLSVSPPSVTVRRGGTANYTATVGPLAGFAGYVTLSVSGAPSGATVTVTPNPATTDATISVKTRTTTAAKTYTLTITGTSGSLTHTTTATLIVTR